jgi:hypothetical protein
MGLDTRTDLALREGDPADFVVGDDAHTTSFRKQRTVSELICDPCHKRTTVFRGVI